jgi:hypothetical protein
MQAAKMGGVGGIQPSVAQDFLDKTPHSVKSNFASAPRPSSSGAALSSGAAPSSGFASKSFAKSKSKKKKNARPY